MLRCFFATRAIGHAINLDFELARIASENCQRAPGMEIAGHEQYATSGQRWRKQQAGEDCFPDRVQGVALLDHARRRDTSFDCVFAHRLCRGTGLGRLCPPDMTRTIVLPIRR